MLDAGTVDERIEPAVTRRDGIKHRIRGLRGGDIQKNRFHDGAARTDAGTRRLVILIRNYDLPAASREELGRRPAEARSPAGDDYHALRPRAVGL